MKLKLKIKNYNDISKITMKYRNKRRERLEDLGLYFQFKTPDAIHPSARGRNKTFTFKDLFEYLTEGMGRPFHDFFKDNVSKDPRSIKAFTDYVMGRIKGNKLHSILKDVFEDALYETLDQISAHDQYKLSPTTVRLKNSSDFLLETTALLENLIIKSKFGAY